MTVLARTDMGGRTENRPHVLGIGGTPRPGSSSEVALRAQLVAAERYGATTEAITAVDLDFPMYDPDAAPLTPAAERLLAAVRRADAVVISSPGYHGGVSGLLKNALDYFQELAGDTTPYLDGRAVGCVVAAAGWQAATTTLGSLRMTVHALRGWPTPLGVAFNSMTKPFDPEGQVIDLKLAGQFDTMAEQMVSFAAGHRRAIASV